LLKQRGIVSVDVNPLTASVLITHDGTLDLRPEDEVAAPQGKPSNRDASLASLAIKLALVVIAQQLS
jgi:hypothetical protein